MIAIDAWMTLQAHQVGACSMHRDSVLCLYCIIAKHVHYQPYTIQGHMLLMLSDKKLNQMSCHSLAKPSLCELKLLAILCAEKDNSPVCLSKISKLPRSIGFVSRPCIQMIGRRLNLMPICVQDSTVAPMSRHLSKPHKPRNDSAVTACLANLEPMERSQLNLNCSIMVVSVLL